MMRATKYILILCVCLNLLGHPIEQKVVGWDWCCSDGHPFILIVFKFGWPIPCVVVKQIWGCLTIPNQWVEFFWPGLIGTTVFWLGAIWIIVTYWPLPGCLGEWEIECDQYPCSDKERCRKIASRRR